MGVGYMESFVWPELEVQDPEPSAALAATPASAAIGVISCGLETVYVKYRVDVHADGSGER